MIRIPRKQAAAWKKYLRGGNEAQSAQSKHSNSVDGSEHVGVYSDSRPSVILRKASCDTIRRDNGTIVEKYRLEEE